MDDRHSKILHLKPENSTNVAEQVYNFKKQNRIHFVLGFSGGADDSNSLTQFMEEQVRKLTSTQGEIDAFLKRTKEEYVSSMVQDVLMPLRGYRIAILTGGTKWGVPKIAAQTAKALSFATIGVFPLTALNKDQVLSDETLDLKICAYPFVGDSKWGDESAVYTEILNSVIIIGGGAGTMVEVAHLLKRNEKKDLPTKHILPIYGTGGTADKVSFFPGKPDTMARCVPPHPLTSGKEVCEYLRSKVFTSDIYEPD